jgi:hypothetical protein
MEFTYGKIKSETLAEESGVAREVVRELGQIGISDRQRWLVMYYLALELENVEEMKAITSYIKEVKGNDLFINKIYGASEEEV